MTRVAIVILNWNGVHFLRKFLPFLIKFSSEDGLEIIVADNASEDESKEYLAEFHKNIRLIELEKNYGFAEGYNRALENIDAEYYMILNSDIEVTENWITPLIALMDSNKNIAACSPVLLDYNKREKYEYAGAAGGYIDRFGYTFCRGRIFNITEKADLNLVKPMEVFWTTGACMLIRSELFRLAEGFDPYFFAHMEEVDLCWRLKNMGYKLAVVPESKVYHVGGGTLPKGNPFKTYLNYRNNLLLLFKNLPENQLNSMLLKRKVLDGLSSMLFLIKLKFKDIAAVYRAHRHYNRKKQDYIHFRTEQFKKYGVPRHDEIYSKSLIIDYFIAGNKSFDKLRDNFSTTMNNKIIYPEN